MTVKYIVKFQLYHYNSGDGRNGFYWHEESFNNVDDAQKFADKVKKMAKDQRPYNYESTPEESHAVSEFASHYCWDGWVQSLGGIYQVTEEKLE
jgi:hypothetical protein